MSEALIFCHRDAKLYHRFVDPSNIYVTPSGDWKLGGFYFCTQVSHVTNGQTQQTPWRRHAHPLVHLLVHLLVQVRSPGEMVNHAFDFTVDNCMCMYE